ncbi:MAG: aconitate hydratase [Nitrososphaerota archaeon]
MGLTMTQKIIKEHLVDGRPEPGEVVSIKVDQVLMQDATGTMAMLEFEAMGIPRIRVPLAVVYVDHNMLQIDNLNADDHIFLRTAAAKYGIYYSRPGNGICHQVHLERFAAPGQILLGSDSHTPTAGGMGMLAIGVGGLEVASAMAGEPYEFQVPEIVKVVLEGELKRPWVTAMDVVFELLRRFTVKGGVGKIFEYVGPGVKTLTVTERATITNFGAELGLTTSIFPSDERTRHYLEAQGRVNVWRELSPDPDAEYADTITVNLSELEPYVAKPHQPDNIAKISELKGIKVDQVCIGSCTNSSYQIMKAVAQILKGRTVAPNVSMTVSPGSRQVYEMLARDGTLADIIAAGARILESACGPCIGMGQAPPYKGVSVRSFNRNFKGRSGTPEADVYLANPLVATYIALKGEFADPRESGINITYVEEPDRFLVNDNMIIPPSPTPEVVEVIKGPNIKEVPVKEPLAESLTVKVLIKVGDNISTDDILPAGAKILPLRSNIPEISKYTFSRIDPAFYERARAAKAGVIVGGENYGQGSSREHAAIAPMYLGVKAVIAKSLARIHKENLINFGIIPLTFKDPSDYDKIDVGDELEIPKLAEAVRKGEPIKIINKTKGMEFVTTYSLIERQKEVLLAGGLLPYIKGKIQAS